MKPFATLLVLGFAFMGCSGPADEQASARKERPNVLLISVDDLNDWVGYMDSHPQTLTPNIDALAARGTAFTTAYSQFPLCGPSRASIFSGLLPGTSGLLSQVKPDQIVADVARQHGTVLLHSYFSEHGYKTMAVGKLMHRHVPEGSVDLSGGRGDWDRMPDGKEVNWISEDTMTDWAVYPAPEEEMSDAVSARWAMERLGEAHDAPFLLMVGFLRPHVPWHVPQSYFDAVGPPASLELPPFRADDFDDIPEYSFRLNFVEHMPRTTWAEETGQWGDMVQAYLASIHFADHYVGQVLDALSESDYAHNTIVVLFSDHGYHLGEKNTFQKHSLWEPANRVPLIFAGPGVTEGAVRDPAVGLIDIYPTLLDLAGLPVNGANEGHSLRPLIVDADAAWDVPVITQLLQNGHIGQAIQSGPWRYSIFGDGSEELYNHDEDPNEWTNLANDPDGPLRKLMDELNAQLPADFLTRYQEDFHR